MASAPQPNSGIRRQWNQAAAPGGPTPAAKRVWLAIYGLLLLGLVAFLAWWLWPASQQVYFAYLAESYGPALADPNKREADLYLPPTATATAVYDKHVKPLQDAIAATNFSVKNLVQTNRAHLVAGDLKNFLGEQLDAAWKLDKLDCLIVYVSAYGVSIDGQAYLAWNEDLAAELDRTTGPTKLFPVAQLLQSVQALPAPRKLVLLDAGQLPAEPRLGMFVNEFAALLEAELKSGDYDRSLWVLAAAGPWERAHQWSTDRRSIFGQFAIDRLKQPGQKKEDLTLAAYVRGVHDDVKQAALQCGGAVQQPMFLTGKTGRVTLDKLPEDILLRKDFYAPFVSNAEKEKGTKSAGIGGSTALPLAMTVIPGSGVSLAQAAEGAKSEPAKSDPSKPADAKKPEEKPSEKPADKPTDKPSDEKPADKPEAKKPDDKKQPLTSTAELFDEAWRLCATIEDATRPGSGWSPVDYAPHLWSKFRRQVAWFQQRTTCEEGLGDAAARRKSLESVLLEPLRAFANDPAADPPASAAPLFTRLVAARRAFTQPVPPTVSAASDRASDRAAQRAANIFRAVRLKNQLTFVTSESIRLYGYAADTAEARRYTRLVEALTAANKLATELELAEDKPHDDRELDWTETPEKCEEHLKEYDRLRREIADDVPRLTLARLQSGVIVQGTKELFPPPQTPTAEDVSLARWIDLHTRLAELSVAATGAELPEPPVLAAASAADKASLARDLETARQRIGGVAVAADLRLTYRRLGGLTRSYQRQLPDAIVQRATAEVVPPGSLREQERLLRLLDAADAENERLVQAPAALAKRKWFPQQGPTFTPEPWPLVDLQPGQTKELELPYAWTGAPDVPATVRMEYADREAGAKVIQHRAGQPTAALAKRGKLVGFFVRPTATTANSPGGAADLLVTVEATGRTFGPFKLQVRVVGEEEVDLIVQRVVDEKDPRRDVVRDDEKLAIGRPIPLADTRAVVKYQAAIPYPNRVSPYRFSLVNRSGRVHDRAVEVEVLQLTEPALLPNKAAKYFQQGVLTAKHKRIDELTRTMTLSLGAAQGFPFVAEPDKSKEKEKEKEPDKKPDDGDAKAKEAAKEKEAKPAGDKAVVDFGHGLVFKVTETAGPAPRTWYHWVEFQPLHPGRYVRSSVVYERARRELRIEIRPSGVVDLPPEGYEVAWDPIAWDPAGGEAKIAEWSGNPRGKSTDAQQVVRLAIDNFDPQTNAEEVDLYLAIDRYPRAIVHRLPLRAGAAPVGALATYRRARILKPFDLQVFKPSEDQGGEFPLAIELQVDADAADDSIEIVVEGDRRLLSPRVRHALVTPQKTPGVALVDMRVSDYVIDAKAKTDDSLPFIATTRNKPINIDVKVESRQRQHAADRRRILIDDTRPRISGASPNPTQVTAKDPAGSVTIAPRVADAGGVAKVDFYLVDTEKDRLEKEDMEEKSRKFSWYAKDGQSRFEEDDPRFVRIETSKLAEGKWWIWAVATDRAGLPGGPNPNPDYKTCHTSDPTKLSFFEVLPKVEVAKADPAKKVPGATVKGRAVWNSSPLGGVVITLKPEKGKPITGTSKEVPPAVAPLPGAPPPPKDYEFEIKDVPPGKYQMTAAGKNELGRKVKESDPVPVTVDEGDTTLNHTIKMTLDR